MLFIRRMLPTAAVGLIRPLRRAKWQLVSWFLHLRYLYRLFRTSYDWLSQTL